MIKFIDIESGNVFDGQTPYVHWFDEAQSVNLIYDKKLFVISDSESLTIGIPNSGIFDILKTDVIDEFAASGLDSSTYDIYDNKYLKIDRVEGDGKETACADLDSENYITYTSHGISYGDYFIHRFYFIAKSQNAGEHIEDFVIEANENEAIRCKIGADFYNEDERLGINLKNFGMESPSLVQKAIYEGNVHEEFQDNILINRKWKELLINYQDCLMCKGSYKSLLNCLEWFGYGDNIKLLEYWRKAYDDGTLFEDDVKNTVYNITKEMLRNYAKTTYIGILLATQKLDPTHGYDEYEPIPLVVERQNLLFSLSDLCLKMTLLGNFFSTYFMPIHLDLIHCSIERLVYSTTIKIIAEGENKRVDFNDSNESLIVSVDSKFKLGDIQTHVYTEPALGEYESTFAHKLVDENSTQHGGVETETRAYLFASEYSAAQYGAQLYGGPGCIVRFKCYVPNVNKTSDCLVTRVIMRILRKDSDQSPIYEDILTNIRPYSDDTYIPSTGQTIDRSIKFNWLFKEWGDYNVTLIFHTNTGKDYVKTLEFTIDEDVFNSMTVKKVQKRSGTELYHLTSLGIRNELFSHSMTNAVPSNAEYYSQYLYTGTDVDAIGMNSIVIIQLDGTQQDNLSGKIRIRSNGVFSDGIEFESEEDLYDKLNESYFHYIWFVRWTIDINNNIKPYLVGIRKNFTISTSNLVENGDGLHLLNGSYLSFERNLYKNFAFSVDNRGYATKMNVTYRFKILYKFEQSLQTGKLYTKAEYQLYRTGSNGQEAPVEGLPNEPIMFFRKSVFSKTFKDIFDSELGINLTLAFEDEVPVYDAYDAYGLDIFKIESIELLDSEDETIRREFINTDRFVPIFHTLADLDDDTAMSTDTLVVIPTLKWLKQLDGATNTSMWVFHNASTNEDFFSNTLESTSINITRPLVGRYMPLQMTPGYYDVILNAKVWENRTSAPMKVESMFLLK